MKDNNQPSKRTNGSWEFLGYLSQNSRRVFGPEKDFSNLGFLWAGGIFQANKPNECLNLVQFSRFYLSKLLNKELPRYYFTRLKS